MNHEAYWLHWEEHLPETFVNLADCGFVINRSLFTKGITSEARCFGRPGLVEALVTARHQLPYGYNFSILDCYRSWDEQQLIYQWNKGNLKKLNPDWSAETLEGHLEKMSPNVRILRRFDKHRYGGAVDLTIINAAGEELDMGPQLSDGDPEGCRLLYYEMRDITDAERGPRDNRRILIKAMESAGFEALLNEWWHWGYSSDIASA
jgi:D-alanyl-D-alanine dipeptidase